MSYGFTGLILRVWAETRGKKVKIMYAESYELHDSMTSRHRHKKTLKFDSHFRAILYTERVNHGQMMRYNGTKYETGFTQ